MRTIVINLTIVTVLKGGCDSFIMGLARRNLPETSSKEPRSERYALDTEPE